MNPEYLFRNIIPKENPPFTATKWKNFRLKSEQGNNQKQRQNNP